MRDHTHMHTPRPFAIMNNIFKFLRADVIQYASNEIR